MKSPRRYILYFFKEICKFIIYYPCTFISKHIDYFHYKALTLYAYPIFTIDDSNGIVGNKCYGNLWAIRNALKGAFHPKCMIEHGLYFGEFVLEEECNMKSIDTIYTYSNYRMNAINKWFNGELKKQIIPVGPYILYADHFKSSSKLMQIKSKLGRVLLVFPSHPAPGALTEYDVEAFLHEVDSVAQNYDSVLVSLFWLDVRRGYDKPYIKRGYKVVCSGVRTDRWFLSRQKDLFSLADFSMSNDVGTHIGYSIAMGVPHYVFKQKVTINGGGAEFSFEKFNLIRSKEYNEIIEEFGSKEAIISSRQREIVEYYWGKTINDE